MTWRGKSWSPGMVGSSENGREAPRLPEPLRNERSIVVARWAGVAFGLLQVTTYNTMPYPPGVQAAAYTVVGALAVSNIAIWLSIRRITTERAGRRLSVIAMAVDIVFVSGILWLYAFDGTSALYLLLFVLPAEAAWRFRLRGVIAVWAASAVLYIGREAYAAAEYGFTFDLVSINFRMGILLIVSLILGLMARDLARRTDELEATTDELRAIDDWRSGFVDMLAHDIRSPLGSAVSTIQTLRDRGDSLDAETQHKLLASSLRSARRVLRLADDLLALARATGRAWNWPGETSRCPGSSSRCSPISIPRGTSRWTSPLSSARRWTRCVSSRSSPT